MGEPIQQRGGHLRVAKHRGPLGKRQIGRDQHAGVLIQLGQQMKQQGTPRLAEGQIPQLVQLCCAQHNLTHVESSVM